MNQDFWKLPPKIKIYEALNCLADKRLKLISQTYAQVISSDGKKKYTVKYDPTTQAIMANDNGSYWQKYLGYPIIAFLAYIKVIRYQPEIAGWLAKINWHKLNQKYKRNYDQVIDYILNQLNPDQQRKLQQQVNDIFIQLTNLKLKRLMPQLKPPKPKP